jgi:hypothetical protein
MIQTPHSMKSKTKRSLREEVGSVIGFYGKTKELFDWSSVNEPMDAWSREHAMTAETYLQTLPVVWPAVLWTQFIVEVVVKNSERISKNRVTLFDVIGIDENTSSSEISARFSHETYDPLQTYLVILELRMDQRRPRSAGAVLLTIENGNIEVFTSGFAINPAGMKAICLAVRVAMTDWMGNVETLHGRRDCKQSKNINWLKLPDNFPPSNVWIPYIVLQKLLPNSNIEQDIINVPNIEQQYQRATVVFHAIGKMIVTCIRASGIDIREISNDMTIETFEAIANAFLSCKISSESYQLLFKPMTQMTKNAARGTQWSVADYESKKWKAFAQIPGATRAGIIFRPVKLDGSRTYDDEGGDYDEYEEDSEDDE